jgi:hypothetical protein
MAITPPRNAVSPPLSETFKFRAYLLAARVHRPTVRPAVAPAVAECRSVRLLPHPVLNLSPKIQS